MPALFLVFTAYFCFGILNRVDKERYLCDE